MSTERQTFCHLDPSQSCVYYCYGTGSECDQYEENSPNGAQCRTYSSTIGIAVIFEKKPQLQEQAENHHSLGPCLELDLTFRTHSRYLSSLRSATEEDPGCHFPICCPALGVSSPVPKGTDLSSIEPTELQP
ncbi:hypothetical protein CEXT_680311 [Caerostris extrusa]|uniref:Uncharacterized protein n=1 Tax=Caerostris extrusa TaxID=172846 RepID=A0AAV4XGY4_CAEEX|nr:hypothetical protein CEXT_680311 [Caerostris extrusa]